MSKRDEWRLEQGAPDEDGDWLIGNESPDAPSPAPSVPQGSDHWAWVWLIGGLLVLALMAYVVVFAVWGELRRRWA